MRHHYALISCTSPHEFRHSGETEARFVYVGVTPPHSVLPSNSVKRSSIRSNILSRYSFPESCENCTSLDGMRYTDRQTDVRICGLQAT
jgi:hypothetical protein